MASGTRKKGTYEASRTGSWARMPGMVRTVARQAQVVVAEEAP